jgi:hypothetical protein
MSLSTLASAGFDGWDDDARFEALVADFDLPDVEPERPARRVHQVLSDREAIDLQLGFRRRRTHEREN